MEFSSNELRKKYDNGEITAKEFLKRLFNSEEADRRRRKIYQKIEKILMEK